MKNYQHAVRLHRATTDRLELKVLLREQTKEAFGRDGIQMEIAVVLGSLQNTAPKISEPLIDCDT